mmetsp:Transcript_20178/g.57292  ORF Transcript_20178/g.57292 Transcript_20178/m.57292 type:complete len:97 (+) Transcript_20178:270-560(+)
MTGKFSLQMAALLLLSALSFLSSVANASILDNGLGLIHDLRQSGSLFQRSASQEQQLQQQRHHNTAAKNQRRATNSEYYPDTFHHQTVVEMNMAGV